VFEENFFYDLLRNAEVCCRQPHERSWKVKKLALCGGPQNAERPSIWDLTAVGFRTTRGVVHKQQNVWLSLCKKDRGAFSGIDLLQPSPLLSP
jgi:hypothetical protein